MNVLSHNCNSASVHKREYIKGPINHYKPEFVCLQETWLLSHDVKPKLSEIDKNYIPHGVSGNNEKELIQQGRPKGGCAILWHESLSHTITEIPCNNRRVCAITTIMEDGKVILIVCAYMPNDNMSKTCI